MIQRIQSVYLLIATVISVVGVFFADLWKTVDGDVFFAKNALSSGNGMLIAMALLFFVSALFTFVAIFQYKKRQLQFVLGRLSILINFILLGILVYFTQNLSGEIKVSEKGIGLLIPVFCIVLVVLANKAIKKDEELVKSVDRLR